MTMLVLMRQLMQAFKKINSTDVFDFPDII